MMTRCRLTLFWLLVGSLAVTPDVRAAQTYWYTDYDTALQVARDKHKPMIFFFYVRGDETSRRVDEIFANEAVALQTQSYVCVRLDGFDPALRPVVERYQVQYLPEVFWADEWGRRAVLMSPPIYAANFASILEFEIHYLKTVGPFFPWSYGPKPYSYPPQVWPAPRGPAPGQPAAAAPNSPDKSPAVAPSPTPPTGNVPGETNDTLPSPTQTLSNPGSTLLRLSPATPNKISPAGQPRAAVTWPLPGKTVVVPSQTARAARGLWQVAPPGSGIFLLDDAGVTPLGQVPPAPHPAAKPAAMPAAKPAKHPLPAKAGKHPLPRPKAN